MGQLFDTTYCLIEKVEKPVSTRALSCNEWYRQSKRKCFKFYVNDLVYTILLVLIHDTQDMRIS